MKNIIYSIVILSTFLFSCDDNHHHDDDDATFEYHAHIVSPTTDNKMMGQDLSIIVNFESHTGETIHHINVKITEATTGNIVYNKPNEAHIHQSSGEYSFTDHIELTSSNGFMEHTDYILTAKVWGSEEGLEEEVENVQFHVHPM